HRSRGWHAVCSVPPTEVKAMWRALVLSILGSLVLGGAPARAACDSPEDLQAVANTRALIDQKCTCELAVSHSDYVRCAAKVANGEVAAQPSRLNRFCRRPVLKCAAKSTCGRPAGQYPCCRTDRFGTTRCKVRLPKQCNAGLGGTACQSTTKASCCDACVGSSCASPSGAFLD